MEQFSKNPAKDGFRVAMFSIHSDPLASLGSQEAGGQNIYVRSLAEELDRCGYAVDIFTRWDSLHKKQIVSLGKRSRVIRLKGGKIGYIPKTELFAILPEIFSHFTAFYDPANPYRVFHGHYWDGGYMALEARKKYGAPMVENFHSLGMVRQKTKEKYKKNGKEQEYSEKRFRLEKDIISACSAVISLSETEKTDLKDIYGCPAEKVKVIPGGVNLEHWPLSGKEKSREYLGFGARDFVILFVGRLEWRKGIGALIAAAKILKEKIPDLKVIVAGGQIFGKIKNAADVGEYNRLKCLSKENGTENLVEFRGRVDHRELSSFYQAADVFAVPSYYEPFGLVALEGMANKIPVVASRVGGLSTIIEDGKTGLLFEPRNPVQLAEKVLKLYQSKDFSKMVAENGYSEVSKNYSWKKIAEEIKSLYNSIAKTDEKKIEDRAHSAV